MSSVTSTKKCSAVIAAVFVWLSGCGDTKIQRLSSATEFQPNEIARLWGADHSLYLVLYNRVTRTWILAVDNMPAEPNTTAWDLPPGPHKVITRYGNSHIFLGGDVWRKSPSKRIDFTAEAGHRYLADGKLVEIAPHVIEYCAWIEDAVTHQVVGGSQQPQSHPE